MDLLAQLEDLRTQYAAANELFESASAELTQIKAALADKEQALATFTQESTAKLAQAALDLEAKVAEVADLQRIVAELKANQKTADEKAIEIVASQGIAPVRVEVVPNGAALSKAEAVAEFSAIKDPAKRADYYAKHRTLLLGK